MNNLRNPHRIMLPKISVWFGEDIDDLDWIHAISVYPKHVDGRKKKLNPPVFRIGYDDQHGMHYMDCDIPHDTTSDDSLTQKDWILNAVENVLFKCERWNLKPEGTQFVLDDVKEYLTTLNK